MANGKRPRNSPSCSLVYGLSTAPAAEVDRVRFKISRRTTFARCRSSRSPRRRCTPSRCPRRTVSWTTAWASSTVAYSAERARAACPSARAIRAHRAVLPDVPQPLLRDDAQGAPLGVLPVQRWSPNRTPRRNGAWTPRRRSAPRTTCKARKRCPRCNAPRPTFVRQRRHAPEWSADAEFESDEERESLHAALHAARRLLHPRQHRRRDARALGFDLEHSHPLEHDSDRAGDSAAVRAAEHLGERGLQDARAGRPDAQASGHPQAQPRNRRAPPARRDARHLRDHAGASRQGRAPPVRGVHPHEQRAQDAAPRRTAARRT